MLRVLLLVSPIVQQCCDDVSCSYKFNRYAATLDNVRRYFHWTRNNLKAADLATRSSSHAKRTFIIHVSHSANPRVHVNCDGFHTRLHNSIRTSLGPKQVLHNAIGLYRDVRIAAIAWSRTSLETQTVVMCTTSQCESRNLHCDVIHITTVWVSSRTLDCMEFLRKEPMRRGGVTRSGVCQIKKVTGHTNIP